MRHDDDAADDIPGGDSFLDIVANIVGILVLLVVVVGVRAGRQVFVPPEPVVAEGEPIAALEAELKDAIRQVRRDERDVLELRDQVTNTIGEAGRRASQREEATLYVTKLRSELDAAAAKLDADDQRSLQTHNAIAQVQLELDRLTREQVALASVEPDPDRETVVVAPTPIINGEAEETISFRLQGDRLVYVPVAELERELSKELDAPVMMDPSRQVLTRETLGPIDGFVGDAEVRWAIRAVGNRVRMRASLAKLVLREVTPLRGEEPDAAFGPGGYVGSRLDLLPPDDYVVRLIVYADSFDTAPEVAQRFRERGFRVAQSLKSDGRPISFSTDGYQAVTQ